MNAMSVVLASSPKLPEVEVAAMWRVQAGALMLLGRAPRPMPPSGAVPAERGVFRTECWPLERGGGYAVVAAIRLPQQVKPTGSADLLLRSAEDGRSMSVRLPPADTPAVEFGQAVARVAGPHAASACRFLMDMLRPRTGTEVPGVADALRAFLSRAAQPDGAIEILAAVPGECVLMQGWGTRLTGPVQVFLSGPALPYFAGHAAEFTRDDTPVPASGTMLALPPSAAASLSGLNQVFVLSETGLHCRGLVEHRLLGASDSLGHLRHMLPVLRCPPAMQGLLRDVLRPRFEGMDTLAGNAHPVRAAVDMAASGAAGSYLSGWVFDPRRLIAELHLCRTDGGEARLDNTWTRIPRPDVSDAFSDEPGFLPPADDRAGFAVSTSLAPGPGSHLRFTFTDGERAFVPVAMADIAEVELRERLLASVDLYKPSGLPILERQVAPLLARVRPATPPPARIIMQGPIAREQAVVLPLPAPGLPRAFLSSLLHDPATETEQLVLACGPEWNELETAGLCDLLHFYGLPATVLACHTTAWSIETLREASRCTSASTVLLLSAGVCSARPGWRTLLRRAAADAAFACPTLLYEDWSIRYAGGDGTLIGMPAALAVGETPVATEEGTLECCLLSRQALAALDGMGAPATEAGRARAFFLRLRAAGLAGVWVPAVQACAPEAAGAVESRAARLVDPFVLNALRDGAGSGD